MVAYWLLIGVGMIIIQILLGGITRLTGSGLSITNWEPIRGAIPPINEAQWNAAFDDYKKLGQYKYLNYDFTLSDFQFIFFWEWFHRLWARLLGVVFCIGFGYFLIRGYFNRKMILPLVLLFVLGGLQGLVGWIMVQSGLNENDLYVGHIRLAAHFMAALLLLLYTLLFAWRLLISENARTHQSALNAFLYFFLVLLVFQLVYGAFMSGLKAAPYASTWPLINGDLIPPTLSEKSWVNHPLNVQFIHRGVGYLLAALSVVWLLLVRKNRRIFSKMHLKVAQSPFILTILQVSLGVATIMLSPKMGAERFGNYELLAQIHQLIAILLLVSVVSNIYFLSGNTEQNEGATTSTQKATTAAH